MDDDNTILVTWMRLHKPNNVRMMMTWGLNYGAKYCILYALLCISCQPLILLRCVYVYVKIRGVVMHFCRSGFDPSLRGEFVKKILQM